MNKAKVAPAVITEVLSLRAAKSHTRRWINRARTQTARADHAVVVFGAKINAGDNSEMTANSLSQARVAADRARKVWRGLEEQIAKLDAQIADLVEEGTRIEARRAAEKNGGK